MKHKQINIIIHDQGTPQELPNRMNYRVPEIQVVSDDLTPDAIVGILQLAYTQQARYFVDSHPKTCQGCPALMFHKAMIDADRQARMAVVRS